MALALSCSTTQTVKQAGGATCTSIQQCVNNIPSSALTGNWCIDIQDNATYSEQITIQNKNANNFQIEIGALSGNNIVNINPPTGSTAAFQIMNASVTIANVSVLDTASVAYGIAVSSAYVTISSVNVNDNGSISGSGINLTSSHTTILYSSVSVQAAGVDAVDFFAGSNAIIISTALATGNGASALALNGASSTTVTGTFLSGQTRGLFVTNGGSYNYITQSTITNVTNNNALDNFNGSYNTISQCYVGAPTGRGIQLRTGSNFNTVTQSTIIAVSASFGFYLVGASSNTISNVIIENLDGPALEMDPGANYNLLQGSVLTESSSQHDVFLWGASWNTISQSVMTNRGGPGLDMGPGANFNLVIASTINAGTNGIGIGQSLSDTVQECYVQGSTAVIVSGSTGTFINSSVLVANSASGSGLLENIGSNNLSASSNVVAGGASNAGFYIDRNNTGYVILSTNVVSPSSQYGIFIATQTTAPQIYLTSNTILPAITASNNTYGIYLNGLISGATIQGNEFYYRTAGSMGSNISYGLYAQSASGLNINHNEFNQPGVITGGSFIAAALVGTTNTLFKFNDLNAVNSGVNLNQEYLLQVLAGSIGAQAKDNIFQASMTVSGAGSSSATIIVDATSQSGFASDYNDIFSFNGANTANWGGTAYSVLSSWQGAPAGQDVHSISANPLWQNTTAGSEDFHPQSEGGRFNPASQTFVQDCQTSSTIDKGDPAESFALEPSPAGGRANQGSYGNTGQASETFQIQPPASIAATALVGQVTISWTPPNLPQSCPSYVDHYELSYSSVSSGSSFNSLGSVSSNTFVFLHTGLQSKTTYFYNVVTADALGDKSVPAQSFAVTPDSIAPAAVTNLSATPGPAVGQVNLLWTFPGDDNGATTLPAGSQYGIQYTTDNISVTWSTGNAQVTISTGNLPVGAIQSTILSALTQNVTYYFRLWTEHPGQVWSNPSNIAASFSKQAGPTITTLFPSDGSSCVLASTSIAFGFTKTMQYSTLVSAFSLTLVRDSLGNSSSTIIAGNLSPGTNSSTFTFTPSATLLKNGTYLVSITTQALDMQNDALMQPATAQFTTPMDQNSLGIFTAGNLGITVTVPGGAFNADGCVQVSTGAVSINIPAANQKLARNTGDPYRAPIAGSIVDIKVYDSLGNLQTGAFGSPVTISLPYPDAQRRGIVDGTSPPVFANTLSIWWLDDANAVWVQLPNSSVDSAARTVTATTPHFTTFAIIGQSATDVGNAYAFPVPFKPSAGEQNITFVNAGQQSTIKIYTLSGGLVNTLTSGSDGKVVWNVTNSNGHPVVSGAYLYVISNDGNQKTGKLMIIR